MLQERPVALLEVDRAVGHAAEHAAAERSQNPASPCRSGSAQAGIWQGVPSGSVQSAQCSSSRAKPRPSSIVSTWNRSSTSSSTIGQLLDRVVDADRPRGQAQAPCAAWHRRWRRCPTSDARRNRSARGRAADGSVRPARVLVASCSISQALLPAPPPRTRDMPLGTYHRRCRNDCSGCAGPRSSGGRGAGHRVPILGCSPVCLRGQCRKTGRQIAVGPVRSASRETLRPCGNAISSWE